MHLLLPWQLLFKSVQGILNDSLLGWVAVFEDAFVIVRLYISTVVQMFYLWARSQLLLYYTTSRWSALSFRFLKVHETLQLLLELSAHYSSALFNSFLTYERKEVCFLFISNCKVVITQAFLVSFQALIHLNEVVLEEYLRLLFAFIFQVLYALNLLQKLFFLQFLQLLHVITGCHVVLNLLKVFFH